MKFTKQYLRQIILEELHNELKAPPKKTKPRPETMGIEFEFMFEGEKFTYDKFNLEELRKDNIHIPTNTPDDLVATMIGRFLVPIPGESQGHYLTNEFSFDVLKTLLGFSSETTYRYEKIPASFHSRYSPGSEIDQLRKAKVYNKYKQTDVPLLSYKLKTIKEAYISDDEQYRKLYHEFLPISLTIRGVKNRETGEIISAGINYSKNIPIRKSSNPISSLEKFIKSHSQEKPEEFGKETT